MLAQKVVLPMAMTSPERARFGAAVALLALASLVVACSSNDVDFTPAVGGSGGSAVGGSGASAVGGGGGGSVGGGGSSQGGGAEGPVVHIHMRSTTDVVAHEDGLAGQTPLEHFSGIRKLQLFKKKGDGAPLTVFDYGQGFVEASYAGGADTVVHSAALSKLPEGTYTYARVVHSHVRYAVKATMHASGYHLPGEFHNLQVLSDDTLLDGIVRNHGYYEYLFKTAGMEFPASGTDAPVPEASEMGGFSITVEEGQWGYNFPVTLVISHSVAQDQDIILEVNMYQSFRWQDQEGVGYKDEVFDTTPVISEPVKRFGANSHLVYLE